MKMSAKNLICVWDSPEAIQLLKANDPKAWRGMLECYDVRLRGDIFVSLVKRGMTDESLEDIAQESWLTAVHCIEQFQWQGEEAFYHWLRVIALNYVRKRASKKYRRNAQFSLDEIYAEASSSWSLNRFLEAHGLVYVSLEEDRDRNEQSDLIVQAISRLKNSLHREIALRALVEGKKPQELAIVYDLKARTISQILWRVKQSIRQLEEKTHLRKENLDE